MNRQILRMNLGLLAILVLVSAVVAYVRVLEIKDSAHQQAVRTARLLMGTAMAVRTYTVEQVKPLLEQKVEFTPLTVSSYAANQTIGLLRKQFPDFTYREATLNPTNPLDRSEDWESDIIRHFRNEPEQTEFTGDRVTMTGTVIVIAQPLKIGNSDCLDCHSTPDQAPKSMRAVYQGAGGYGWKLNEIVGAQVVTVPIEKLMDGNDGAIWRLARELAIFNGLVLVAFNCMLFVRSRRS